MCMLAHVYMRAHRCKRTHTWGPSMESLQALMREKTWATVSLVGGTISSLMSNKMPLCRQLRRQQAAARQQARW